MGAVQKFIDIFFLIMEVGARCPQSAEEASGNILRHMEKPIWMN
jgi:hypothetical protein